MNSVLTFIKSIFTMHTLGISFLIHKDLCLFSICWKLKGVEIYACQTGKSEAPEKIRITFYQ